MEAYYQTFPPSTWPKEEKSEGNAEEEMEKKWWFSVDQLDSATKLCRGGLKLRKKPTL